MQRNLGCHWWAHSQIIYFLYYSFHTLNRNNFCSHFLHLLLFRLLAFFPFLNLTFSSGDNGSFAWANWNLKTDQRCVKEIKTFWVNGEWREEHHRWFVSFKEWWYVASTVSTQTRRKTQSAKNVLKLSAVPWPEKNSLYGLLCAGLVPALPAKQLPSNPAFPTTFPRTCCVPRKKSIAPNILSG